MSEDPRCTRCGAALEPVLSERPNALEPPFWTCEGTPLPHVRSTGDAEFDEMVEDLFIEQDAMLFEVMMGDDDDE